MARKGIQKSHIAAKSRFSGKIIRTDVLSIDGKYEGDTIRVRELFIGRTGRVKANVKAGYIVVEGIVIGNIESDNRVILMPTAKVLGKIITNELIVQKGVVFEGNCIIVNDIDSSTARETILKQFQIDG